MGINFHHKVICDNIHGSIGISELEQNIINTRTFQRLKKIKQLGLASLVFPGAEHSRFAHSIGVMHLMSKMVDRLREENCEHVVEGEDDHIKQKLRLAALLHDIGHYPLAHLGEQVFMWVDETHRFPKLPTEDASSSSGRPLLAAAADKHKSDAAKHERLGELILCSAKSEIHKEVQTAGFEPAEIASIFNGEHKDNPFYTQLMSSTLDCDRMDFLVRDSMESGTSFGHVDINYILRNLTWDEKEKYVCFQPKAINAIEHFIMGRYFSYNVTYHKTVMGFELMAKALFFAMMQDTEFKGGDNREIVRSFEDVKDKVQDDWTFLANFNDEYFWYYLEQWGPEDATLRDLKRNLLYRIPLRIICEERVLDRDNPPQSPYYYLADGLIEDGQFKESLNQAGVEASRVAVVRNQIRFEAVPYRIPYDQSIDPWDKLKLVKIRKNGSTQNLLSDQNSIVHLLSQYQPSVARLYALVGKGSDTETRLKDGVKSILDKHRPQS